MRDRRRPGTLPGMTTRPTTLTLHLERIDPVRGTIAAEDGSSRPFLGWLELAAALEQAMQAATTDHTLALREAP
jgi:hypothetical protein